MRLQSMGEVKVRPGQAMAQNSTHAMQKQRKKKKKEGKEEEEEGNNRHIFSKVSDPTSPKVTSGL